MKKRVYFVIGFILLTLNLGAQNLNFFHYGLEEGISQQTIRSILKDSKGFLWLGTQDGLNRFDGQSFKVYKPSLTDTLSITGKFINDIVEAKDGTIWIATANKGVCYYDPETDSFVKTTHNSGNCTSLTSDRLGNIYATFLNKGVAQFSKSKGAYNCKTISGINDTIFSFTSSFVFNNDLYLGTTDGRLFQSSIENPFEFNTIRLSKSLGIIKSIDKVKNTLLIGSADGLYEWNTGNLRYINLKQFNVQKTENLFIESIKSSDKDLYVGTDNGFFILKDYVTEGFNPAKVDTYKGDKNYTNTITSNRIYDILVDEDLLWIGTNNLDVATLKPPAFKTINTKSYPAINNSYVFSILSTDHYTFIGTRDGLNCIDKSDNIYYITKENTNQKLSYNVIRGMCIDNNQNLWLATTQGVSVLDLKNFDPKNPRLKAMYFEENNSKSLSNNKTRSVYLDHNNTIWVTTYGGGINRFTGDLESNLFTFERYKHNSASNSISSDFTFHISQDNENAYWITSENGLNRLSFDSNTAYNNPKFKIYNAQPGSATKLQNNTTLHTLLDSENKLWVATQNGLHLYDKETDTFKHYNKTHGLTNTYVYAIIEDEDKMLWVSTNDGLFKFDKAKERFTQFSIKDGIQSTEFNLGAYHYDGDTNQVYFGGVNGFNVFNPKNLGTLDAEGFLTLTELKINNDIINPISRPDVLRSAIFQAKEISINHDDFPCTIQFSDLDLRPQKNTKFLYRLNSRDWNYANNDQQIQFVNLPNGSYQLEIQGQSRGEFWKKEPLKLNITVIPPWYKSNLAYVLYFLLFFGVITAFYRIRLQRQIVAQESKRLRDIDALKSKFITNITHEFRTPLTLIMGYTETLNEKHKASKIEQNALNAIEKNSTHLLTLVNEMMDLAKLEQGQIGINLTSQDIITYTKYLIDSFGDLIEKKNIKLEFSSSRTSLVMDFDAEKYRQIITNLISNAIKFSKPKSTIRLTINTVNGQLAVDVIDQGEGIPEQDLPFIFDRFYQSKNNNTIKAFGSGVGLALTKELIELMGGTIKVNSTYGEGTTFRFTLPITSNSETRPLNLVPKSNESKTRPTVVPENNLPKQNHTYTILLVEDNTDIANYISTCLGQTYKLLFAFNGIEGIKKAQKHVPDIVITDLMMPKMDGYELTKALQENDSTNHIPVIILTAKSQQEDRLAGFRMGADAYLTKPFQREELLMRIEKLIEKRKQLQHRYQTGKLFVKKKSKSDVIADKNILFLNKAIALIHENLENSAYNAECLAKDMALSESQLYRKLKAITSYSSAIFIRNVRLEKARELLETTSKTVSEIAYETGFNDPNWFSKAYKEAFGHTPSSVNSR